MRGETMYLMAKRDKALIPDALRSYNDALVRYPDSSMAPQAMMRRGSLYLDQEFNIEALTEFGSMLRTDPKGKYAVNAMLSSARIYMQQKKYVKAYNELEKILLLFPAHRQVRDVKYMMAETYHDRGQYGVADKIFAEAMKTWPTYPKTNPATFMKIADTSLKLGRINEALEDWYTIINLHPVSTEARVSMLNIADVYTEINKKKQAARTLENLVAKYPKNKEAALARIRLASLGAENPELLKGSEIFDYTAFEKPFKTLDDVIEKFPDSKIAEEAMLRKGKAYSAQKRYISSVIAFKELLRTYPSARMSDEVFNLTQQSFLKMIGKFYEQDGFFTVLMTYYDNFDPFLRGIKNPVVLAAIADSYSRLTLYDRALEYYRLANRYDEKGRMLPGTAFRIAKAYLDKSDFPEARKTLERYLKDFPQSPHAVTVRHLLGDALYELGRHTEAATEWRLAIEADPANPRVSRSLYNLAFGYKTAGQYTMAVDSFNRAIDTYKPAIYTGVDDRYIKDSHFQLAEVYYLEQDYPNAIREARAARERYPEDKRNEWMDYIISVSYERINMDELAMAKLEDLSRRAPSSPIGRVSTAKLKTYEWKMKNPELFID